MSISKNPIGIFDSGVGGLSILKAIRKLMSAENLIYVADSQFTPYGNKSAQQIEDRVLKIAKLLIKQKVKAIVVACNTATAASVKTLRDRYTTPIIGLEPALKPASENTQNGRVGVIATQTTLDSQKYQDLKKNFAKHIELTEKASPLFVELVENAHEITEIELSLIERELSAFKKAKIDSLVLGCTHYPFLTDTISNIMGAEVTLYESGLPVALEVQRRLQNSLNTSNKKGLIRYFSSNPAKSQAKCDLLLGKKIQIEPF